MSAEREKHRGSLRLNGYDYAQAGAYFITICSHQRQCLFGEIRNGQMQMNAAGSMVQENWETLPERFPSLTLDIFVVMPNHLHGIVCLTEEDMTTTAPGRGEHKEEGRTQGSPLQVSTGEYHHPRGTETGTIGRIVQAFKSITTHQYAQGVKHSGWLPFEGRVWQRNYHEHIIRHEKAINSIREYIAANPAQWLEDADNPNNISQPL